MYNLISHSVPHHVVRRMLVTQRPSAAAAVMLLGGEIKVSHGIFSSSTAGIRRGRYTRAPIRSERREEFTPERTRSAQRSEMYNMGTGERRGSVHGDGRCRRCSGRRRSGRTPGKAAASPWPFRSSCPQRDLVRSSPAACLASAICGGGGRRRGEPG